MFNRGKEKEILLEGRGRPSAFHPSLYPLWSLCPFFFQPRFLFSFFLLSTWSCIVSSSHSSNLSSVSNSNSPRYTFLCDHQIKALLLRTDGRKVWLQFLMAKSSNVVKQFIPIVRLRKWSSRSMEIWICDIIIIIILRIPFKFKHAHTRCNRPCTRFTITNTEQTLSLPVDREVGLMALLYTQSDTITGFSRQETFAKPPLACKTTRSEDPKQAWRSWSTIGAWARLTITSWGRKTHNGLDGHTASLVNEAPLAWESKYLRVWHGSGLLPPTPTRCLQLLESLQG